MCLAISCRRSLLLYHAAALRYPPPSSENPVYLHIVQRRKPEPDEADRPLKKPTLLAIGVEGGFSEQEPEYDVTYEIVVLPEFVSLPFPSVDLPEKVRLAVDKVILAESADRKQQLASWLADKKIISAHAMDLQQLDNGVIVPPTGWKCSKCDKTENIWLNLTDGMILCGRRLWDGSGGNNHAVQHYQQTKYPLAVKLGTITADLEGADVYSYPEDDSVEDPILAQHLSHFGIGFSSLQKMSSHLFVMAPIWDSLALHILDFYSSSKGLFKSK